VAAAAVSRNLVALQLALPRPVLRLALKAVAANRNLVAVHKPKALVAAKVAAQPVVSLVVKAVAASRSLVAAHKPKARVAAKAADQPAASKVARANPSKPLIG
jgi:hypothetical protein